MATWTSASYDGRYLQLSISESVNVVNNTSALHWELISAGGSSSYYTVDTTTVTINGSVVYSKGRTYWDDRVFPAAKGSVSGDITVSHNSDGRKTIDVGFSTRVYVYGPQEYGGSMTLTGIDRTAPTVSCSISNVTAKGFKVSASASATSDIWQYCLNGSGYTQFSTTAGTSASVTFSSLQPNTSYSITVRARKRSNHVYGTSGISKTKTLGGALANSCSDFSADAGTVSFSLNTTVYNASYSNYITIQNGSVQYLQLSARTWSTGTANRTITLNATERATLLAKMAGLKSFTATIQLITKSGTTQIGNASTCTCKISTRESVSGPSLSGFTFADTYSVTTGITGNNQVLIQDYSKLSVTPGSATARNGASIASYSAVCSGVTKSNTTGDALSLGEIGTSGTRDIILTVTDSRGYTASVTKKVTVVPYSRPKVNSVTLRRTNDIETEMQLSFQGSISGIIVGAAAKNSLLYARYRYKLTNASSYGSFVNILSAVSKNGTSFSYTNKELCNLTATASYDFHLQICDRLNSLTALDLYFVVPQGTPLVALRKQKVGINTPSPDAALHVVGTTHLQGAVSTTSVAASGTVKASSFSGSVSPSDLSSAVPITKGGTGATSAASAAKNIVNGQSISPAAVSVGESRYYPGYGLHMNNSDMIGLNGIFFSDSVDSGGEGVNFYRSSGRWDRLYSYGGTLYYAPNCATDTHPGTRYTVYHSGGSTIPVSKGGTGSTYASGARVNLGITCTTLYNGSLSSGSTTFNYGSYKAYIIVGDPCSGCSRMSLTIPKNAITTSDVSYQIADESYFRAFKLRYSGSTVTLTIAGGYGSIKYVFGVN